MSLRVVSLEKAALGGSRVALVECWRRWGVLGYI